MRFVKPEVFLIAKSAPDDVEIRRWLDALGCDEGVSERYANGRPRLISGVPEGAVKSTGERIVELAGRRCYLAFQPGKLNPNVQRIREDIADYCENILKSGHGSVLEHVNFTFAIENVSRVFTGEMNRHRAGMAISEGSMRFIRYTDIPIVETPLLTLTPEDKADIQYIEYMKHVLPVFEDISHLTSIAVKKQRTREAFLRICFRIEETYSLLRF